MTSRIEPYRVSAYNTSKHSENKMHDDTVAKRYGFVGGLVPGVDVMAYMMHLPVAQSSPRLSAWIASTPLRSSPVTSASSPSYTGLTKRASISPRSRKARPHFATGRCII